MFILLVDAMPLVYSNFAKVGSLSVQNGPLAGTPTGLRFGFLRSINSYKKRTNADRVVIAWDTQAPVKKAQGCEDFYKAGRSEDIELGLSGGTRVNKEDMFRQIPDLQDMIGLTSWVQVQLDGYEADDLIGHYARELSGAGYKVMIVSPDNDLCQLVNNTVQIFIPNNPKKGIKKDGVKDLNYVRNEFGGPTGQQLTLYRAIIGDKSDNIKGVADLCNADLTNYRKEIREALSGPRTPLPTTPSELVKALGNSPVAQELDGLMDKFEQVHGLMTLHSPPPSTIRVRKGVKSPEQLKILFDQLEFKLLLKEIPNLCS